MKQNLIPFLSFLLILISPSTFLGQSTVLEHAQKQAIEEYPDLAIKDSAFNIAFRQAAQDKLTTDPAYMGHGEWPLTLAHSLAHSLGAERELIRYTVFQSVKDGALVKARYGKIITAKKLVDWAAPNPLDGHRRADAKEESEIVWGTSESIVFLVGAESAQSVGEGIFVYPAGEYHYTTITGQDTSVSRYATSVSLVITVTKNK